MQRTNLNIRNSKVEPEICHPDTAVTRKSLFIIFLKRLLVYLLGNFILAIGVAFTVKADLGLSPINTLPYVISKALGTDLGFMITVIYSSFIIVQLLILKRFRAVDFLQIFISILFGYFVTLSEVVLSAVAPVSYLMRLVFFEIGLLLIGLGIMLYLAPDLMPQPPEGLLLAIQYKSGWKFSNIKIGFDCITLVLAVLAALLTGTGLSGIREGTLISALTLGKIIALFSKLLHKPVMRFCFGPREACRELKQSLNS